MGQKPLQTQTDRDAVGEAYTDPVQGANGEALSIARSGGSWGMPHGSVLCEVEPPSPFWEMPSAWFEDLFAALLHRHGSLYVIQPHPVREVWAPACWEATGHICDCRGMG